MINDVTYKFITVKELVDYLFAHPEKEVGFTSDDPSNKDDDLFMPSGWYGIKYTKAFDGNTFLCGYYGEGVDMVLKVDPNDYDGIYKELNFYWFTEFLGRREKDTVYIDADTLLCIDTGDLK